MRPPINLRVKADGGSISGALATAFFEWAVIVLLLFDALFSFLITSLARYGGLEIPCLLCSRLDHVIGKAKPGFLWDQLCRHHKMQLSSLVFCHVHEKFVSVHEACELCILSFIKKEPLLTQGGEEFSPNVQCLCCEKPWDLSEPVELLIKRSTNEQSLRAEKSLLLASSISGESPAPISLARKKGKISASSCGGDVGSKDGGNVFTEETARSCIQLPNNLELSEAYKLAVGGRGRQLSSRFSEEISRKCSSVVGEDDMKILRSHVSIKRGIELSPRVSMNTDQSRSEHLSGSAFPKVLDKIDSMEKNEWGCDSMDWIAVSNMEGESPTDRLTRQVEHDKRLLRELYQDLEEERNASAVAVNQAMAMITRVQKEKAELQMEALQYLRVMEEQAEYDSEALQRSNDLIFEKEKRVQDLEQELLFYKDRFGAGDDEQLVISTQTEDTQ